jgi:hypothetical protein
MVNKNHVLLCSIAFQGSCFASDRRHTTKACSDLNMQNTTWRNAKYDASRTNDITAAWPHLLFGLSSCGSNLFQVFDECQLLICQIWSSESLGPPSLCWPYFLGSTSDVAWLDWRKHDCFETNIKQGWCQKHVTETVLLVVLLLFL